ncbi:Uncharacterised protein [Sphingobacterium thalpophilum]|uniref:Uncharacterized protein n=1 Tax=Sphingobacterium thalpophilum TaxID=259 RepID=A0A4U9UYA2_9SPHI|nr:Uncharacterised protein [Sphingobacterium thalpophilum]
MTVIILYFSNLGDYGIQITIILVTIAFAEPDRDVYALKTRIAIDQNIIIEKQ